jgi:branched-chain amino acid transport system substrate-binding protein
MTRRGVGSALVVVALVATGCGGSSKKGTTAGSSGGSAATGSRTGSTASAPGVTPTTIKIGFITSLTGDASSTFSTAETGAKAYFDALNKAGGIDGRKIELIAKDDASSASGALSATRLLLSEGVYGIVVDSSYFFGAYKVAQAAGVPVTGTGFDGPEWGEQPNTNMFATIGGMDPNHPELQASLGSAEVAKFAGATNVGGLAYSISPSSTGSIKDTKTALESVGLKMGYENLSIVFGTSDVSTPVLAMKQANVNFAICSCVQSTVLAMVTGLAQAGSAAKSLSQASADSSLFSSASATQAAQGMYYASTFPPLDRNNPASNTFVANIQAADTSYRTGEYPSFGVVAGYLGSALMAKGLQVAGANPTRQSFIQNLTKVTSWDADGLLPAPVGFDHFGTGQKTYCEFYVKVQGPGFVAVNGGKPLCLAVPPTL